MYKLPFGGIRHRTRLQQSLQQGSATLQSETAWQTALKRGHSSSLYVCQHGRCSYGTNCCERYTHCLLLHCPCCCCCYCCCIAALLQPKKKVEKKYTKGEYVDDTPLDDPEAERLRKQRLEEESDFRWVGRAHGPPCDTGAGAAGMSHGPPCDTGLGTWTAM